MNDTISRIRLLKRLKHRRDAFCKNRIKFLGLSKNDKARVDEMDKCIAEVINAPTIEPERKKGRWLTSDDMYETGVCSVCKCDSQEPVSYTITMFKYCPNCGADMRGEQDVNANA